MSHVLEANAAERAYFERQNKNGKAAWRRIVRVTTGGLPSWAEVTTRTGGQWQPVTTYTVTTPTTTTEPATGESGAIEPTIEKVESMREFLARRRAEQEAAQTAQKPVKADDADEVLNALDDD